MSRLSGFGVLTPQSKPWQDAYSFHFETIYHAEAEFVWKSLRRLGVPDAQLDDTTQDVFIVVYRRLAEFSGRSALRTWLFAICLRVARKARRLAWRSAADELSEALADESACPISVAERHEAAKILSQLLHKLDEPKRAVFILAELEEMTAFSIGEALGANPNTVYSRLRAARRDFERAVERHLARSA